MNFAVQVPEGKTCELLLYKKGKEEPEHIFEMPGEEGIGEVRFLMIEDIDAKDYEYNFRIGGKVCIDPYVREITGRKFRSVGSRPVQRLRGGGPAQVQLPNALAQGKDGGGGDRELVNAHA